MNTQSAVQRAISLAYHAVRKAVLPLAAALAAVGAQAQTTITFDDVPSGMIVDGRYAGVSLSNPLGGNVIAAAGWYANSGANVVSITSSRTVPFDGRDGAVDVTFSTLQVWASIDVAAYVSVEALDTPTARPFIEAYDSNGNLVARSYFQGVLPAPNSRTPYETMTVSQPTATIKRVRFSVQVGTPRVLGSFDNLRFSIATPFCSARLKLSGGC